MTDRLNAPHGGTLVDLLVSPERALELKRAAKDWPSWDLSERQICDLELLLNGGFSPLRGFLGQKDYASVCERMRLENGALWPMPITLDVSEALAEKVAVGKKLALRDPEGVILAVLTISDIYRPDREAEAQAVFGTTDPKHPGAAYAIKRSHPVYLGGTLEGLQLPHHYDYRDLRLSPAEVRATFQRMGWRKVVAFQTRNPIHRAHFELTKRAAEDSGANLLIHPVVGMTKPGDVDHYTRVRCYRAIMPHYPLNSAQLSLLPLAMRMGGPREAVWHALIRKNYGCSHFIVGRDHAGPGKDSAGKDFYGPYDAQELLKKYAQEIGIEMVPFLQMSYVAENDQYYPADKLPAGAKALDISGTELRTRLQTGREIPEWFSYPEVVRELRATHPPRSKQGFTVFFTGLSGSGKSTIANVLLVKLLEMGGRPVTLLDGDIVRKHLSSELGFSKEHRDINIRRIGYVASEITKNGGIALCAPIAPYESVRSEVRDMISPLGGFVLVHMSTPIETCETRDRKGLYAAARAGKIKGFTGIDDPYEVPPTAEIRIDTSACTPAEAAQEVILYLEREGFIGDPSLRHA
ncbi:MAG: bifunctional sulfate adenylyltransferase/adenylylsulfate kinase [Planctomycetes bacterium]|nr:bifunctional sulfate adenylyltransferase/adenylylsulfate kinase [Planctomycetota bacterium]